MIVCPNCGSSNQPVSRFCENCGADLRSLAGSPPPQPPQQPPLDQPPPPFGAPATPPPPVFVPPPVDARPPWDLPPTSPDWRMSSLPPEPPPARKRRTWLWILLGLNAAIIICCCAFTVWASTAGEDTVQRWATEINDYLTETSATREAK